MTKWQEQLKKRAENGDQAADDILWETQDMNDAELAMYLVNNDERVRSVLQMKSLAEKDADPALTKEYYDLLNKGQMAFQGEGRFDPYGQKPLTIEEYMEKFGIEKGPGGYSDDQVAAFTNPENRDYFAKVKTPDQMKEIAVWIGSGSVDRMVSDIERTAAAWQRRNQLEGYGADNEVQPVEWALSALKGFTLPRVKEAQLEGRPVEWQDITGDMVELGLNFIPGVGIVSKTGKVVARLPKVPGAILKTGAYGADVFAVPGLSQTYDVGVNWLTDRDVPRNEFDLKRMGAQAALMGTGKASAKSLVRTGKDIMEGSLGEAGSKADYRATKGFLESIGEKTDDQIARRQAMLDRKAELAMKRENVVLEGDRDIASAKQPTVKPQDIAGAENYRILTGEADRLARSDAERQAYRQAASRQEARERVFRPDYSRDAEGNVVRSGNTATPYGDRGGYEFTWTPDSPHNFESTVRAVEGVMNQDADRAAANAYRAANEKGAVDIVMLDDGRFVRADRVRNGAVDFGQDYPYPKTGYRSAEFTYDPNLTPSGYTAPGVTFLDGATVKPVNRNVAVKAAIEKEPELARKLSGKSNYTNEVARDVAASVLFTGAAHNDLFGNLGDLESKRADAWWNAQMRKLGEFTKSNYSPKERLKNFEAIMDVMTYGLDNIPTEKFAKSRETFHAIATKLGYPKWLHPSEIKDAYSSASASNPNAPTSSSSR